MTEAERTAAGRESIRVRPRAGTRAALERLAAGWDCSMGDALERLVRDATAGD